MKPISSDEDDDDGESVEMHPIGNGAHADEIFDPENFNDEYFRDLLTNLRSEFSNSCYTGLFTGISCAVHCLHLVVTGAIKSSSDLSHLVDKCRTLAKKLRAPNMRGELRKKSKKWLCWMWKRDGRHSLIWYVNNKFPALF